MFFTKGVHKNISDAMHKQAELIGLETGTGCSVREKMNFMFFNHQFHGTTTTVNDLVDEPVFCMGNIGYNKTGIWAFMVVFGFTYNPFRGRP